MRPSLLRSNLLRDRIQRTQRNRRQLHHLLRVLLRTRPPVRKSYLHSRRHVTFCNSPISFTKICQNTPLVGAGLLTPTPPSRLYWGSGIPGLVSNNGTKSPIGCWPTCAAERICGPSPRISGWHPGRVSRPPVSGALPRGWPVDRDRGRVRTTKGPDRSVT